MGRVAGISLIWLLCLPLGMQTFGLTDGVLGSIICSPVVLTPTESGLTFLGESQAWSNGPQLCLLACFPSDRSFFYSSKFLSVCGVVHVTLLTPNTTSSQVLII